MRVKVVQCGDLVADLVTLPLGLVWRLLDEHVLPLDDAPALIGLWEVSVCVGSLQIP